MMPKIKALRSPAETFGRYLRATAIIECGSVKDMGDMAGICHSTMHRRVTSPMDLSLRELHDIRKATGVPVDDLIAQLRPLL